MVQKIFRSRKLSTALQQLIFTQTPETQHRVIIELRDANIDPVIALIEQYQGKVHCQLTLIPSLVVELPYSCLFEIAKLSIVKKIWQDAPTQTLLNIAVPAVGGSVAQGLGFTGKGVVIAVIDTGIAPHPDFTTPENRITGWIDLIHHRTAAYDDDGHGTHVSGIIAGNGSASNGKYVGMAPDAHLIGVKALDAEGTGSISTIISGIEWCLTNQTAMSIRAINLSVGAPAQDSYRSDPLCRAVASAWKQGIVICAAAGNSGPRSQTINSPGITPSIITVGNIDDRHTIPIDDDQLNPTSSRGPTIDKLAKPDILAPGTEITSTWLKGGYLNLTGTSMATPMVTGAVAQILQKWPSFTPTQVKTLITKNARQFGFGLEAEGAGELAVSDIFKPTYEPPSPNSQRFLTT